MHIVEIFLPLDSGSGGAVPLETIEGLVAGLAALFGGATAFTRQPAEGLWKEGTTMQRDRILVVEVMVDNVDEHWWSEYRKRLERVFKQEEVLIRVVPCQRI